MKEHATALLYGLNLSLIFFLATCYFRGVRGVWPPGSRRMLAAGWAWYIILYAVAFWAYLLELKVRAFTANILLATTGATLLASGIVLMCWAFKTFGSYRRILGEQIDKLITEGPYRYTRNPQYLATIMILLGISALHESSTILGFTALQALTYYLLSLLEERELRERFGRVYEEYTRKVPRFIPRPHRLQEGEGVGGQRQAHV